MDGGREKRSCPGVSPSSLPFPVANLLHERGSPPCTRSGMAALPATCGACHHEGTPSLFHSHNAACGRPAPARLLPVCATPPRLGLTPSSRPYTTEKPRAPILQPAGFICHAVGPCGILHSLPPTCRREAQTAIEALNGHAVFPYSGTERNKARACVSRKTCLSPYGTASFPEFRMLLHEETAEERQKGCLPSQEDSPW